MSPVSNGLAKLITVEINPRSVYDADDEESNGSDTPTVRLDLMQGRLENKIGRLVRILQFDIVALSALITIVEFGDPQRLSTGLVTLLGATLLMSSVGIALVGITMNATPFDWPAGDASEPGSHSGHTSVESLAREYERRLAYVQHLVPLAYVTTLVGPTVAGMSLVRQVGFDPLVNLPVALLGLALFVTAGVFIGRELGHRSKLDDE